MLTEYFDAYARAHRAYKGGAWCYEDGCIYRGLELLHRTTGEARWLAHIERLIEPQIGPGRSLAGYDPLEYNIDNVLPGRTLLYLHEVTGKDRFLDVAGLLADQLAHHPRTESGVYWHKKRYPSQIWLDGLYMGVPFQIGYGLRTDQPDLVADALAQISTALEATFVPATGLYAHAYDEARHQSWADPQTGQSAAHWARALGWLAMALVDIADLVGPDQFEPLKDRAQSLFAEIERLRRPNGLWFQVIDQPDLRGNYEESSASAMFTYALTKARDLALCSGSGSGSAGELFDTLISKTVQPHPDGGYTMTNICEVAGLGAYQNRFRDGSAVYYLSEPLVHNDAKGVGPLMMCHALQVSGKNRKAARAGE